MVRGMHKGTSHIGKVPAGLMAMHVRHQRIEELRARLDQAIASESYEEAAGIRDEIRNLGELQVPDQTPALADLPLPVLQSAP